MRRTSAIASANRDVVCSKVYAQTINSHFCNTMNTYHALFATLFTIGALDIEHEHVAGLITVEPDALRSLLTTA